MKTQVLYAQRGAPKWFDDWLDYCTKQVRAAVAAGEDVPTQNQLDRQFDTFMASREQEGAST